MIYITPEAVAWFAQLNVTPFLFSALIVQALYQQNKNKELEQGIKNLELRLHQAYQSQSLDWHVSSTAKTPFIQCPFKDPNGTADDKQCTRQFNHKGSHSIPMRMNVPMSDVREYISNEIARQQKL